MKATGRETIRGTGIAGIAKPTNGYATGKGSNPVSPRRAGIIMITIAAIMIATGGFVIVPPLS